jgi:hypothetical protein
MDRLSRCCDLPWIMEVPTRGQLGYRPSNGCAIATRNGHTIYLDG